MAVRIQDLPSSIRHEVAAGNSKRAKKVLQVIGETRGLPGDTATEAVCSVLRTEFPDLDLHGLALGSNPRGTGKLANVFTGTAMATPADEAAAQNGNGKHPEPLRPEPIAKKGKLTDSEKVADRSIQDLLENERLALSRLEVACDRIASATYAKEPRSRWTPLRSIRFLVEMGYLDGDPEALEKAEIHYADGSLVRKARELRRMSQDELCRKSNEILGGKHREGSQLSRQESGEAPLFGSHLTATALALNVPEQWLWKGATALPNELPPLDEEARNEAPKRAAQESAREAIVEPAVAVPAPERDATAPEETLELLAAQEPATELSTELHQAMLEMGGFAKRVRLLERELTRLRVTPPLQSRVEELEAALSTEIRKRIEAEGQVTEHSRLAQLVSRQKTVIDSQRATISSLENALLGSEEAKPAAT